MLPNILYCWDWGYTHKLKSAKFNKHGHNPTCYSNTLSIQFQQQQFAKVGSITLHVKVIQRFIGTGQREGSQRIDILVVEEGWSNCKWLVKII